MRCLLSLVCAGLFAWTAAAVQLPDELKPLEFDIEVQTLEFLNQQAELDPQTVARDLGLEPPVYPPSLAPEQVKLIIANEVQRQIDRQYPHELYDRIQQAADAKFRMYKVNDKVTVRVKQRGTNYHDITDIIQRVTDNRVVFASNLVTRDQLHPDELPHFYYDRHQEAVKNLVTHDEEQLNREKSDFQRKVERETSYRLWREYGYAKLKVARDGQEWIPRELYFRSKYENKWNQAYQVVHEKVTMDVLGAQGYVVDEVTGKWVKKVATAPVTPAVTPESKKPSKLEELLPWFRKVRKEVIDIEPEVKGKGGSGLFDEGPGTPKEGPGKPATGAAAAKPGTTAAGAKPAGESAKPEPGTKPKGGPGGPANDLFDK